MSQDAHFPLTPPEQQALPQPPRKPEPHECCGTGCIPCVMDIYEEELFEYEKALRKLAEQDAARPAAA